MPELNLHPTALKVYSLLIYGKGDGKKMIAARVAEELGISKVAVGNHIATLSRGYIRRITKNPAIYEKGENAAILDELVNSGVNPPHGRGSIEQYCGKPDINAPLAVPTGETHICGRYIFPVLHQGGMSIKIKDATGERNIQVFDKEPKKLKNGVEYYPGSLPLDDEEVNLQFWDTTEPKLHVWPKPVMNTASTILTSKERLLEKAERAANVLMKFGMWRLGQPTFVPNEKDGDGFHYATNDPLIMGNFPTDFQPAKESGYYIDGTPGPQALETHSMNKGQAVLDFYGATKRLESGQSSILSKLTELDNRTAMLIGITENLEHSLVNAINIESVLVQKAVKDSGVMFQ